MKKLITLALGAILAMTMVMATVAPMSADLSSSDNGCYSDGATIADWGYATNDGNYGGVDESEFCLVWDVGCQDNDWATVDLYFPPGPQVITIKHLDGLSNMDSFVIVDGVTIGTYTDSLDDVENWVESSFDVDLTEGMHTVEIQITDSAWDSCNLWGQLAVDYIRVSDKSNEVPEFGILAAFGVLALAGLFIHQRRK